MLDVCVLYDVENIGGGAPRAWSVLEVLREHSLRPAMIALVGRKWSLARVSESLGERAPILCRPAPSGKDASDVLLAAVSGRFLGEALARSSYEAVVLVSNDKKLALCLRDWVAEGLRAFVLAWNVQPQDYERIVPGAEVIKWHGYRRPAARVHEQSSFSAERYPYIYDHKASVLADGLTVVSVPNAREPVPFYIPLPPIGEELAVGLSPSRCDIPLDYWRSLDRKDLYDPHVFFGLSRSGWYVRSAKGCRRGNKAVVINGGAIDASRGNVPLRSGDAVSFGGFDFRLAATDMLQPPRAASSSGATSAFAQVVVIERFLQQEVVSALSPLGDDWWESQVPESVRVDCERRKEEACPNSDEHPLRFAFIRDLEEIFAGRWDIFQARPVFSVWGSKTRLRKAISHFMMARNKVMHPTRMALTDHEEALLTKLAVLCSSAGNG